MAIGLGHIMGFDFPENFNYPYISKSITEFWRRWHITLSTWFREYVYIPLGGNRKGKLKTFINLFIVWFLTGLWHGASWNFVIWGLYFWLLLVLEKAFLSKLLQKIPTVISHLYSLFFIILGWYIFISCDIENPLNFLTSMFSGTIISTEAVYHTVRSITFLIVLIIASTPLPKLIYKKMIQKKSGRIIITVLLPITVILCTAYLVDSSYNPFLYFRF
jgi:alginate O-acetyltransferase complex protein AlgI